MKISILTLFPEMFKGPFDESIIKRAKERGLVEIEFINIRDFGIGKHKMVDDTVYGGGVGMVMRVDVLHQALEHAKRTNMQYQTHHTILLSAQGKKFTQKEARELKTKEHLILICGHYEGIDERIKTYIDEEMSVGDFVTTGGEIPAMLITDAIVRLLPDVLKDDATEHESFSLRNDEGVLLEYPQYTKPRVYGNQEVPEMLLSGDHKKIEEWRMEKAERLTEQNRPDLQNKKT